MLDLLRNERGAALLMAVGTLAVFAIVGTTLTYYTTRNAASAEISKSDSSAFALAEAGLHSALAVLSNPDNDPLDTGLLPETTTIFDGGRAVWSGTYSSGEGKWTITSTGYVESPSATTAAEVERTLTAKVPITAGGQTQPLAFNSWNFIYSWGTDADCDMTMDSSVDIASRVMVAGDLCMVSSSQLSGSTTTLAVGGQLKVYASAHVGADGAPIARADVAGGCSYENGTVHSPCTTADKVWATTVTSAPEIEPVPTPDTDDWYANASPGPYHPCQVSSGTTPTFDNDQGASYDPTKRNRSVPTDWNLTRSSSYTCRTLANGQTYGELSWNFSTKVLTIAGTVFIDGDAYISRNGSYTGQGTLYLSGSFRSNGFQMCAVVAADGQCDFSAGAWNPNTRLLTLVAMGAGGQNDLPSDVSVGLLSSTQWQGAIYGGNGTRVLVDSSTRFSGPILADEVDLDSSVQAEGFDTITTSPVGMPGNGSATNGQLGTPELFSG